MPNINGDKIKITPTSNAQYGFKNEQLCTYMILFPGKSAPKDKLQVSLINQFKTKSLFMTTKSYNSNDFQKAEMKIGYDFSIGYPYRVYLTFLATGSDTEPGDFEFTARFMKFEPGSKEEDAGGNVILVGKFLSGFDLFVCRAKRVGVRRLHRHHQRQCGCACAHSVPHGWAYCVENPRPKNEQGAQASERQELRSCRADG